MTPEQKSKSDQKPPLRIITSGINPAFVANEDIEGSMFDVTYGLASNPPILYKPTAEPQPESMHTPSTEHRLIG